jgi:invasion protein IalB
MTARARNALRRPVFIGAVSVLTFVASLVALIVVPQQAKRAANAIRPAAAAPRASQPWPIPCASDGVRTRPGEPFPVSHAPFAA